MAVDGRVAIAMPVVHAVSEAVFEGFAVFAGALLGPVAVAEDLKAGVPNLPEVVGVDIALGEALAVDVGTGADGAVDEDGGNVDAGVTEVWCLAYFAFVGAEVAFAGEGDIHRCRAGGAFLGDEVHELDKLGIGEV